jgi:3,4-dihydroxy 2-butanone 4-phosphate synthase/GTP cyclohydrolase II
MPLNTIEEIIEDLRQGKMVILMDDEDRENEGDLIMAAQKVRPEDINFMARFGRGLVCLTLTRDRCKQLQLPLMVSDTNDKHSTNFTVSIEAAQGVTTGISASDRAVTVQAAVKPDAKPGDLVQPGHIFPIMAQPGGVLTRAGHTEAGCDLTRLAGFEPAAVIVEILNEDGTMARRPDLEKFAEHHGLKIGTIADLIQYRLHNEKTLERIAQCNMSNEFGTFRLITYQDQIDQLLHFALVWGNTDTNEPVLIRVHMNDFICDVLQADKEGCSWPLPNAMRRISEQGTGIIVILNTVNQSKDLVQRMYTYQLEDDGIKLPRQEKDQNLRTYGIGAQIIADLGVHKMRVLSTPKKFHGLAGFGLEVVEYVACD